MIELSGRAEDPPVASVSPPRAHFAYNPSKRLFDILFAGVLLVVLAPLLLVLAVVVITTSRGPVFFAHSRRGLNGIPIRVYKFRTMVDGADRRRHEADAQTRERGLQVVDGPVFKSAHDPRVTPVGRFLRRFSLDELPQLFNVIGGSMSLVGPRPLVDEEIAALTPRESVRQGVKPGMTCIWQISGRSRVGFGERISMDVDYVERRSLLLDLWLLVRTPFAAITSNGAF